MQWNGLRSRNVQPALIVLLALSHPLQWFMGISDPFSAALAVVRGSAGLFLLSRWNLMQPKDFVAIVSPILLSVISLSFLEFFLGEYATFGLSKMVVLASYAICSVVHKLQHFTPRVVFYSSLTEVFIIGANAVQMPGGSTEAYQKKPFEHTSICLTLF